MKKNKIIMHHVRIYNQFKKKEVFISFADINIIDSYYCMFKSTNKLGKLKKKD